MDIRQGDGRFGEALTARDRFGRVMHYQHVDYVSHLEFGYWDELKEDWLAQGHLPASFRRADGKIPDRCVEEFFGIEQFEHFGAAIGAWPLREIEVLEEAEGRRTYRDGLGVLRQEQTSGRLAGFSRRVSRSRSSGPSIPAAVVGRARADEPRERQSCVRQFRLVHRLGARLDRL